MSDLWLRVKKFLFMYVFGCDCVYKDERFWWMAKFHISWFVALAAFFTAVWYLCIKYL